MKKKIVGGMVDKFLVRLSPKIWRRASCETILRQIVSAFLILSTYATIVEARPDCDATPDIPACGGNDDDGGGNPGNGGNNPRPKPVPAAGNLTVFSLNVAGIGKVDGVPWEQRANRIAAWFKNSGNIPDIIGLQEVYGWLFTPPLRSCGRGFAVGAGDYDQLDILLKELQQLIGVTYRIAYLTGRQVETKNTPVPCTIYHSQAILYNPTRLVNVMPSQAGLAQAHDADGWYVIGDPHLRNSLPLCNRGTHLMPLESLIDGPLHREKCDRDTPSGPAWAVFGSEGNSSHIAATFVRLAFRDDPTRSIDVFNVHPNSGAENIDLGPIRQLLFGFTQPSTQFSRYYPPIMVTDHNSLRVDKAFSPFKAIVNPDHDVVDIAIADVNVVPAQYRARIVQKQLMPGVDIGADCPGPTGMLVSDHCGVFVRFELDEPNAGDFRKLFVEGLQSVFVDEDFTLSAVPSGGGPQFKYLWQPGDLTTASVRLRGAASPQKETWTLQVTDLSSGTTLTADHSVVTLKKPPECNRWNCCECNPDGIQCYILLPARGSCP